MNIGTDLSSSGCLAAQFKGRFKAMRQEVALDVEVLGVFDEGSNLRR